MRPGDEVIFEGSTWIVLDPSYLGNGPLLENTDTGDERVVTQEEWDLHRHREMEEESAHIIIDPHEPLETSSEVPVSCPTCGEISHLDLDSVAFGEAVIMDCSVCCRPMNITRDGNRLQSEAV